MRLHAPDSIPPRLILLLAAMSAAATLQAGRPGESPGRKHTTVNRMRLSHLKAAHGDVEALKAKRRPIGTMTLPKLMGDLKDFKGIFHAHAEDSAHTGGSRPEMLADAGRADVEVIFLSNHFRPPFDFITETWRGVHDGVLFIPGSESHGFLIHPMESVIDKMEQEKSAFIETIGAGDGLLFLSHVEERTDHPMDGLTGMEIYNRHADAKDDNASMFALMQWVTDPGPLSDLKKAVELYPDEILAAQLDYPQLYLDKWDEETQTRRVVGIAANDCHHNQVFIVKMVDEETVLLETIVDDDDEMRTIKADARPGIREMTKGRKPGDVLARLDFDPYYRSFYNVSTHIFASALDETTIRKAVAEGHCYVSHDWMCDPKGFTFIAIRFPSDGEQEIGRQAGIMGDEVKYESGLKLAAEFPLDCTIRLLKNGEVVAEVEGNKIERAADGPGVYRLEGWVTVDDELRPWIYSNPIYVK